MTLNEFQESVVPVIQELWPKAFGELNPAQLREVYRGLCFLPVADAVEGVRAAWRGSPRFLPPVNKVIDAARACRPDRRDADTKAEPPAQFWRRYWSPNRRDLRPELVAA